MSDSKEGFKPLLEKEVVKRLREENARLREALLAIHNFECDDDDTQAADSMRDIAGAAIDGEGKAK